MEMSFCPPLQLQEESFLFDCESLLDSCLAPDPTSDLGYFSAASSLSPTSSVDSFCFSPACLRELPPAETQTQTQTQLCSRSSSEGASTTKRSRSRYPGKKRQTASEREKLRMRDLTKAMHHLRTFLPPSVAPAGATLTKIETLRLAIRYISSLSAQLGLGEEALEEQRRSEEQVPAFCCRLPEQPAAGLDPRTLSSLQHSYQVSS